MKGQDNLGYAHINSTIGKCCYEMKEYAVI